ncbi:MAG: universal stress protein [Bacteroidota bacterium]
MYRYKSLLVHLDLTGSDESMIQYAQLVASMAGSDRVRFVHTVPPPLAIGEFYPRLNAGIVASDRDAAIELEARIDHHFRAPGGTETSTELLRGTPLSALLRTTRADATDLVLISARNRSLANRLVRKAPCSVMVVPEKAPAIIERVLVPVDFSRHAADAVEVAAAFAEAARLDDVHVLHVYDAPRGEEEAKLRQALDARYVAFAEQVNLHGLDPVPHFVRAREVPEAVHAWTMTLGVDLVVMGTRGRTDSAAVLAGSATEAMVRTASVPVIAVKRKGSTLGLLDVLLGTERNDAGFEARAALALNGMPL